MKSNTFWKAVLIIVIGILLCCSIIDPSEMLNWTISIALLVIGVALLAYSIGIMKTFVTDVGLAGALALAIGILFLPALQGGLMINWMSVIAMILMVIGAAFLVDGVVGFILNKRHTRNSIILVLGAVGLTLGLCLWLIPEFRKFAGLMLGIFLICYGILLMVPVFTNKKLEIKVKKSKK